MNPLSWLNLGTKFTLIIPMVIVLWTVVIGGPVTEMPFDTQNALQLFANTIHSAIDIMPFLDPMWNVLLWGIQIKIFVLSVQVIQFVIGLFLNN